MPQLFLLKPASIPASVFFTISGYDPGIGKEVLLLNKPLPAP
jgi:hypothetical protein